MLNKAPIFVNGFQRGGTTLLVDLLLSHPNVCGIGRETHQIFYGLKGKNSNLATKWIKRFLHLPFSAPVLVASRQHTFSPICLDERNKLPHFLMSYVDLLFYWHKLNSSVNKYKVEDVEYLKSEIKDSRLLCKNLDGVVLATDLFSQMYPDATFIGIVRNGLAICEGFVYRGYSAEYCGKMYDTICQKMISDSSRIKNYHIVYFEDMLSDYVSFLKKVYEYAGLDLSLVKKFRMYTKKSMGKDGVRMHNVGSEDFQLFWLTTDELANFLRQDVNTNQIQRLSQTDKDTFLKYAGRSMEYFGYI